MKTKNHKKTKALFLTLTFVSISLFAFAEDYYVWTKDAGVVKVAGDQTDSVKVESGTINFYSENAILYTKALADIDSISFSIPQSSAYPNGVPHEPGVVEVEDFDRGGEGIAFHDTDLENTQGGNYRTDPADQAVDIQAGSNYSNGFCISVSADEWLNYTINAPEAGFYAFAFWTLNDHDAPFDLVIDGELAFQVIVPNSSWGIVKVSVPNILLSQGTHTITLKIKDGFGIDKFEFNPTVSSTAYPGGIPHQPDATIEFEDFDKGGEGIAFHDDGSNWGQTYRTDSQVDMAEGASYSNNFWVAAEPGEWLNYTIYAPEGGVYSFVSWAGIASEASFDLLIDGRFAVQVTVPNSSWAVVEGATVDMTLPQGQHVLTIRFNGGGGYDKFKFWKK